MGVDLAHPEKSHPESHPIQIGFRMTRAKEDRVLQVRNELFAYSHMPPYTEWAQFRREAHGYWEKFRAVKRGVKFTRCGLRYINRIDIPSGRVEVEDYFSLYPEVPKSMPHSDTSGMHLQLQVPQPDIECMANIVQAGVQPVKPDHVSVLFDIDLFRTNIEDWDDSKLWDYFDTMRKRKNEIFEACITERTRSLFR
jgi:uncharacterized protein (TIGR04255 family)